MNTVHPSPHAFRVRLGGVALLVLVALASSGCEKEEPIAFYQAPKDPTPVLATQPAGGAAAPAKADAAAGTLHWDVPDGWKEAPAKPGQMRFATFVLADGPPPVELTVIPLGPEAGELLPNINRWEGQLGLPHTPKDKLDSVVKHQDVNGLHADVVDLTGPETANPRQRMLAAIVPHGGKVWFFKATGPVDAIGANKEKFDAFIGSLHPGHAEGDADAHAGHAQGDAKPGDPHAGHAHGEAKAGDPHAGHAHGDDAKPQAAARTVSKLTAHKAPGGWRELADSKPPRMLAFGVGPEDQKADLVVTRFAASNAGSFLDNVNRWRGQLGLTPVADPEAVKMKDATVGKDGQGILVEFDNPQASPAGGKKMVVLIASAQGDLWFIKMTGPSELITAERGNFDAFVKSLEFGAE